jgi:hypothetical protein
LGESRFEANQSKKLDRLSISTSKLNVVPVIYQLQGRHR